MKRQKLILSVRYLFTAAGMALLCLPALLSLEISAYKYFICFGVITAALAVILPELLAKAQAHRQSGSFRSVKQIYTDPQEKAA